MANVVTSKPGGYRFIEHAFQYSGGVAAEPGFAYSDAVKKLGGNWTPEDIAEFIYKPSAYAPGTKMTFPGLPKPEERADVIAFLNSKSDSPVDLKSAK